MKLLGLCQPVIIVMILLPFVDSLVSNLNSESDANQFFEIHEDFRLVGHVIETSFTDEFDCGLRCKRNVKCQSYNSHSDGQHGEGICELNDQTRHKKTKNLIPSKGSTYYEKIPRLGEYSFRPGHSCKHIRDSGESRGDGEYWIDPENNGNPLSAHCDMTTDGEGWLLIYNIVIDGPSPPAFLGIEKSYRGISNYNNNNMVLETPALRKLRTHLHFTQLRFYCNKQQVGRTFHVATAANSTGEAVVRYFSRQTSVMPQACGSFTRLEGDNSALAGNCARWGLDYFGLYEVGLWGHKGVRELYQYPAFINSLYHWTTAPEWDRWECDDFSNFLSPGDFWKIYVR